jgi:hypothetical protein
MQLISKEIRISLNLPFNNLNNCPLKVKYHAVLPWQSVALCPDADCQRLQYFEILTSLVGMWTPGMTHENAKMTGVGTLLAVIIFWNHNFHKISENQHTFIYCKITGQSSGLAFRTTNQSLHTVSESRGMFSVLFANAIS